jgi:heme/copper-type cytochrome/quinol oxidase subunit 2
MYDQTTNTQKEIMLDKKIIVAVTVVMGMTLTLTLTTMMILLSVLMRRKKKKRKTEMDMMRINEATMRWICFPHSLNGHLII